MCNQQKTKLDIKNLPAHGLCLVYAGTDIPYPDVIFFSLSRKIGEIPRLTVRRIGMELIENVDLGAGEVEVIDEA